MVVNVYIQLGRLNCQCRHVPGAQVVVIPNCMVNIHGNWIYRIPLHSSLVSL